MIRRTFLSLLPAGVVGLTAVPVDSTPKVTIDIEKYGATARFVEGHQPYNLTPNEMFDVLHKTLLGDIRVQRRLQENGQEGFYVVALVTAVDHTVRLFGVFKHAGNQTIQL